MSDTPNPQPTPEPGDAASVPPPAPGSVPPTPEPAPAAPPPPQAPQPLPYAAGPDGVDPTLTQDDRTMGMLCHIAAFAGHLIPFGNIVGPLVLWLIKKDQSAFVDDQGKESLNFQITVTIAMVISFAFVCVFIGYFMIFGVWIAAVVYTILAAVAANKGIRYRYPFTIRLIN